MSKRSELAGSLAQVAISALGGPAVLVRTALSEGAKHAQSHFEEKEQAREVRKRVADALDAWASGEGISPDDLAAGLSRADDIVRDFGLDFQGIADLDFDADRVSSAVLDAATSADPSSELDSVQVLATRAVRETYAVLIAQLRAKNETSIALFLSLQRRFDELAEAQASREDIIRYLRGRIADWDTAFWRADLKASAIERALRYDDAPRTAPDATPSRRPPGAEDISREPTLVILGEPGSGKTWFMRMLARKAAQKALDELERGGSATGVEIPLYTTWQRWADTPGDTAGSLVASSFASGLGFTPLADRGMRERLDMTLLESRSRVVVMVDSLDEAADVTDQAARLKELFGLPARWRVVISSRHAAWEHAMRRAPVKRSPRQISLRGLRYPTDVVSFIHAWFAEPDEEWRADALLRELARRRELVGNAVLPLILTFYCLLAQGVDRGDAALPQSARDLYRRLAARLLLGSWRGDAPGPDGQPDIAYCEQLLKAWAWAAFRAQTRNAGGRPRDDSFVQDVVIRPAERRAIDHIAPKTDGNDEGVVTRQFIHRTFLEYYFAEYVCQLDAGEAARALAGVLTSQSSWTDAAWRAVVVHNQEHKGILFEELLRGDSGDGVRAALERPEGYLLTLAALSDPDDWTPEHQSLINRARITFGVVRPQAAQLSARWAESNYLVLLSFLKQATQATINSRSETERLAETVAALTYDPVVRREAADLLIDALSHPGPWQDPRGLARAVRALPATKAERGGLRAALLARAVSADDPEIVRAHAEALAGLIHDADEYDELSRELDAAIPGVSDPIVRQILSGLRLERRSEADPIE
ncbi:NACHT domain-containing NTPase [Leifsonia sp. TF02-11]|uniref:NACHT domain-containing protein n=1 Tax=Leifsonia sp. TF02-11 TaxID=2815212 RepID=UPI001AA1D354|nr:NACHT domain-containing protein [Leifsonia sp. TF02-11]MBO1741400.1 NACHT domain-containing protein [Leifsonia sp. TF02-11]